MGFSFHGVTYWFPGLNQFKSKKIREKTRTIHEKTGKSRNLWHGGYSFSYSWGIFVYKSRISMRGVPWTGPLEVNSCLSVEEIMIFISEIMWDNYIKLLYLLTYCINYRVFFSDVYWINGGSRSRSSQVKSEPSAATAGCFHSGHLELVLVCNRGFHRETARGFTWQRPTTTFGRIKSQSERGICLAWAEIRTEFESLPNSPELFLFGKDGRRAFPSISKFFRVFFLGLDDIKTYQVMAARLSDVPNI